MKPFLTAFALELIKTGAALDLKPHLPEPNAAERALKMTAPAKPEAPAAKFVRDLGSPDAKGAARKLRQAAGLVDF